MITREQIEAVLSPEAQKFIRRSDSDVVFDVRNLSFRPGDVLVVRLGDPTTGWIPGPEDSNNVMALFRRALDEQGHTDVLLLQTHFGAEPLLCCRPPETSAEPK